MMTKRSLIGNPQARRFAPAVGSASRTITQRMVK